MCAAVAWASEHGSPRRRTLLDDANNDGEGTPKHCGPESHAGATGRNWGAAAIVPTVAASDRRPAESHILETATPRTSGRRRPCLPGPVSTCALSVARAEWRCLKSCESNTRRDCTFHARRWSNTSSHQECTTSDVDCNSSEVLPTAKEHTTCVVPLRVNRSKSHMARRDHL